MRRTLALAFLALLAGCASPPPAKQSFVLQPGTKLIVRGHDDAYEARKTFRSQTDYWRTGSVVELSEPLVLTLP